MCWNRRRCWVWGRLLERSSGSLSVAYGFPLSCFFSAPSKASSAGRGERHVFALFISHSLALHKYPPSPSTAQGCLSFLNP